MDGLSVFIGLLILSLNINDGLTKIAKALKSKNVQLDKE